MLPQGRFPECPPPPTAVTKLSACPSSTRLTSVQNACSRHWSEATAHNAGAQVSHAWRQGTGLAGGGEEPHIQGQGAAEPQSRGNRRGRDAHRGAPAAPHWGFREHTGTEAGKQAPETRPPRLTQPGGHSDDSPECWLSGRTAGLGGFMTGARSAPDSASHDCAAQGHAEARGAKLSDATHGPVSRWRPVSPGRQRPQAPGPRCAGGLGGQPGARAQESRRAPCL